MSTLAAPLPVRKRENPIAFWSPWLAGLAAAVALAALIWSIVSRIVTAAPFATELAMDLTEAIAFDTGEVQPLETKTQGNLDAARTSIAAAQASLSDGTPKAAEAATQVALQEQSADLAAGYAASAIVAASTALSAVQALPPFATLTPGAFLLQQNAPPSPFVFILFYSFLKIGTTVTGFFSGFLSHVLYDGSSGLTSTPLVPLDPVGGMMASDQDPTGPALSWMPASDYDFQMLFEDQPTGRPEQGWGFLSPGGTMQLHPPSSQGVIPAFTLTWTSAS